MDTQTEVKEILDTGVTQEALAARLQCSQALVSALLNGKRGRRITYEIGARLKQAHAELVRPKPIRARAGRQPPSVERLK